jgi:general secretion pathway protein D
VKRLLPGYCSLLLLLSSATAFGQAAPAVPKEPDTAASKRLLRAQAAARAKKPADAEPVEPDPPGAQGALPTDMEKIAQATDVPFKAKPAGHLVKFNLQDADLAELVNHISGLTGRRFIYGAKVRQIKATVVSPEPVTLEEAYQAFLSILEANGMTVVPHGRFLKIVDSAGVAGQATPIYSRGEPVPDSDRYITRLYRLEHASPDEVMAVLNKFKSKEADITAHPGGRLLIITDTATQVRRMIRMIEEIDVGGAGQRMWIERIENGAASDMAKRLNEMFELGGAPGAPPGAGARAAGVSRVIADDASNSLVVVGSDDGYLRLLEVLKRLDSRTAEGGRVHVLRLQHGIAEEMAATLTQMLGGGKKDAAGNAGGMFEGEVRVTPDKSTNTLVITSSNRDHATLRLVVDKLDQPRRQVFIEAVIMDLAVSDTVDLGTAFHAGSPLGGDSATASPLLLGGFQAGRSLSFPADPSLLQGFAAGVRGPNLEASQNLLGTGLSIPAFGIVLNTLASSGKSNILATPHIIATDNVPAEINIGDEIPLQTNVGGANLGQLSSLAGGAQGANPLGGLLGLAGGFSAPRADVGNRIKVTPHVNESNQVRLEIQQESSAAGAAVGALGAVPITKRQANTTVVVQDQQTVVIGGLMRDEYTNTRTKIPVLGDLPLLGALFRRTETVKRKANLLLILTPHVIRDQGDLRRIFERKMQERQEFLDRYFVFTGKDWTPPRDWSRTNGLVEQIRKTYRELEEQRRLEEESAGEEAHERQPTEPILLPSEIRNDAAGGAAPPAPRRTRRERNAAARENAAPDPAAPAAPLPAPAQAPPAPPPPPPPPAPAPEGKNDLPFRIQPVARSVERTE